MPSTSHLSLRMSWLLCALVLLTGGCDRARELWTSARGADEASPEVVDAEGQTAQSEAERKHAKQRELEAAEARIRERVAADQRRVNLEAGDAMVASWAERLGGQKQENGAFVAHEGLTDDDPWGKQLRVQYSPADAELQTFEVRSAGPNGVFEDDDDLLRTRETTVERSFWARYGHLAPYASLWLLFGVISAAGMYRRSRRRKRGDGDEGIDAWDVVLALIYIAFAPLTLIGWIFFAIADMFGIFGDVGDVLDLLD